MTDNLTNPIATVFNRAAATYDSNDVLPREVGTRLFERLDLIRLQPQRIIDLGCNTGHFTQLLQARYKKSQVIALDIAVNMLRQAKKRAGWFNRSQFVAADAAQLPFADHSIDLIFSNLVLQWCPDLITTLRELRRVLKPEGVLLFSIYGPDTLKELKQSWAKVDEYSHVNSYLDMHDLGDLLMHVKFADPVVDMEMLTLHYQNVRDLFQELKALGAKNISEQRRRTLTGKHRLQQMLQHYEQLRNEKSRIPATYEIIYGHAWGPDINVDHVMDESGEVRIPLSHVRRK